MLGFYNTGDWTIFKIFQISSVLKRDWFILLLIYRLMFYGEVINFIVLGEHCQNLWWKEIFKVHLYKSKACLFYEVWRNDEIL